MDIHRPQRKFGLNKRFNRIAERSGNDSDYPGPSNARFKKLKLALASNTAVNEDIALPCAKKANGLASGSRAKPDRPDQGNSHAVQSANYSQVAVEFHAVGEDVFGGAARHRRNHRRNPPQPQSRPLQPARGLSCSRLAVGPWFDPSRQGTNLAAASANASSWVTPALGSTTVADREASWMTLSEALALLLRLLQPAGSNDPFFEFGNFAVASGPNPSHPPQGRSRPPRTQRLRPI